MAKVYLDSHVVDLPRSQWRYVQVAPSAWLVLVLMLSIVLISLWWSVVPQRISLLPTSYPHQVRFEPERGGEYSKTQ